MLNKKLLKRKIEAGASYRDMLATYSAADVKEVAKKWGVNGLSKYKKDELVDVVVEYIMGHLEERFYLFNLDHITIVNELLSGNNLFSQFPVAANELTSLGLIIEGSMDDEMSVLMHKDVATRFVDFFNANHDTLTYNTIFKDYIELAVSLYGVMTEEFLVNSFFAFNEESIDKETIQSTVLYSVNRTKYAVYTEGYVHYYRLGEFDKVYNDIQQKSDIEYKVITQEMLQNFVKNSSCLWMDHYNRFAAVTNKHFPHKDVVDLVDELLVMASYNHGVSDYVQLFAKKEEDAKMEGIKAFADVAISVNNEIPHWELKGNAPMALSKYQKQMPIVKDPKIGRNDPCPCGSGKKYKKCCLGK